MGMLFDKFAVYAKSSSLHAFRAAVMVTSVVLAYGAPALEDQRNQSHERCYRPRDVEYLQTGLVLLQNDLGLGVLHDVPIPPRVSVSRCRFQPCFIGQCLKKLSVLSGMITFDMLPQLERLDLVWHRS